MALCSRSSSTHIVLCFPLPPLFCLHVSLLFCTIFLWHFLLSCGGCEAKFLIFIQTLSQSSQQSHSSLLHSQIMDSPISYFKNYTLEGSIVNGKGSPLTFLVFLGGGGGGGGISFIGAFFFSITTPDLSMHT